MSAEARFATADLWDRHHRHLRMIPCARRSFGNRPDFAGPVTTLRTREGHGLVRRLLEQPGNGRVLVIDSDGERTIAMLGDRLARTGLASGWAGVVVNGVVRDTRALADVAIGVFALGSTAMRSFAAEATGDTGVRLTLGGVAIDPDDWIYADEDAVLVSRTIRNGEACS